MVYVYMYVKDICFLQNGLLQHFLKNHSMLIALIENTGKHYWID